MVVALGPGKFYGRILARPRFYDNPIGDRVSPPTPVLDPLMSWAEEAHWSMGGLSFKRLRLQGRIEGNIKKLKAERAKFEKKGGLKSGSSPVSVSLSPSPPPAPLNLKRKRRLIDEPDDENDEEIEMRVEKRGPVRKLDDEFDRVASSKSDRRTRSGRNREDVVVEVNKVKGKKLKKGGVVVVTPNVPRTSPREDVVVEVNKVNGKKLKKGGVVVVTPNVPRTSPREDVVVEVNKVKGKKLKKGEVMVVTPNVPRTSPREDVVVEVNKVNGKKLKKGEVVVVTPNVPRTSPRLSKRK